jgi:hypothetical protein
MGKHCHCGCLGFDLCDRRELLHICDAVHYRIDLSFENVAMGQLAFGAANLNLPTWVEKVCEVLLVGMATGRYS